MWRERIALRAGLPHSPMLRSCDPVSSPLQRPTPARYARRELEESCAALAPCDSGTVRFGQEPGDKHAEVRLVSDDCDDLGRVLLVQPVEVGESVREHLS